jgi:hypothetical protein
MTDQTGIDWPTCNEDGCQGIRLQTGGNCLAHADSQDLDAALKRLSQEGTVDARGVTINAELLGRILSAAPPDEDRPDRPRLINAMFDSATFGDRASFAGVTFGNLALFGGAAFGDDAMFDRTTFGDDARFIGATFGDRVRFVGTTFGDRAMFVRATFGDRASLGGAIFGDDAQFNDAIFGDEARFVDATFGDDAVFRGATFGDIAMFADATFGDIAMFADATFGDRARFDRVSFSGLVSFDDMRIGDLARFGPVVANELSLRRATFGRSPDLVISADHLRCSQTKFPDGARLRVRWAEVTLDNADFGRPSVLEAAPASQVFTAIGEKELIEDACPMQRSIGPRSPG